MIETGIRNKTFAAIAELIDILMVSPWIVKKDIYEEGYRRGIDHGTMDNAFRILHESNVLLVKKDWFDRRIGRYALVTGYNLNIRKLMRELLSYMHGKTWGVSIETIIKEHPGYPPVLVRYSCLELRDQGWFTACVLGGTFNEGGEYGFAWKPGRKRRRRRKKEVKV